MGALGSIASGVMSTGGKTAAGYMSADAANRAGKVQTRWLEKMEKQIKAEMDPALVNQMAYEAEQKYQAQRQALLQQVSPELAGVRKFTSAEIAKQLSELGTGPAETVADRATREALESPMASQELKNQLIDKALDDIKMGATLPPDVQAELVKAGLEGAGSVTGRATGVGTGGTLLRQMLGTAALNLQAQRRQEAQALAASAAGLESQRQQVLQNLFPRLKEQQLSNLKAQVGGLTLAEQMTPQAGLSGQNVANLWLSRVGALNTIMGQKANVQGQAALGIGLGKAAGLGALLGFGQTEGGQAVTQQGGDWLSSLFSSSKTPGASPNITPAGSGDTASLGGMFSF